MNYLFGFITIICVAFSSMSFVVMYNQEIKNIGLQGELSICQSYLEDVEGFLDENQLKHWREHQTHVGYGEGRVR